MTDLSFTRVGTGRLVMVYVGAFIAGLILVIGIYFIAETWFNFSAKSGAMGVILPMIGGMMVGQYQVSREKAYPASGRAWKLALICAVLTILLQLGLVAAAIGSGQMDGTLPGGRFDTDEQRILAIMAAAFLVIDTLVIRLGIRMGIRQGLKQQAQLAKRQGADRRPHR